MLLRILQVKAGEGRLLALLVGLSFLISTGGSVGGNAIDALFFAASAPCTCRPSTWHLASPPS